MFDAPWHSRAIAVLTQESIPPLKSTTAFRETFISTLATDRVPVFSYSSLRPLCLCVTSCFSRGSSNSLGSRVPNKFVELQPEPHRQSVRENPFHEHARLEARPLPLRILEHRRKQNLFHTLGQPALQSEIAG